MPNSDPASLPQKRMSEAGNTCSQHRPNTLDLIIRYGFDGSPGSQNLNHAGSLQHCESPFVRVRKPNEKIPWEKRLLHHLLAILPLMHLAEAGQVRFETLARDFRGRLFLVIRPRMNCVPRSFEGCLNMANS